ncbi:MAG TPA: AMP-binding protein [Candidatus Bathyarchaeia archaeon]|nr:AMP-binding protein [Candidatus Bathyarchaeia archaeon]
MRIDPERLSSPWARRYREERLWRGVAIGAAFRETAARHADADALLEGDASLAFAELARRVEALARGLEALGVRSGDRIAYQLPNWWEAATAFLATVSLGACAVPIVPILRAREVGFILEETEPRVVFVPHLHRGVDYPAQLAEARGGSGRRAGAPSVVVVRGKARGEEGGSFRGLDFTTLLEEDRAGARGIPLVDPDALAVVIYTSGSTATPKGAMHTHNTLTAELTSLIDAHGLGPGDRVLMPSPLTHISGVVHGILAPALLGTSAVLMERWQAAEGIRLIERHRVTYLIGAPTFLQEILADPAIERHDVRSLRLCASGGASVSPELMRLGRERIPTMVTKRSYGSSEFPTIATTSVDDALARGLDTEGRALRGNEIQIADASGRPLPAGEEGEIRARGPECFLGYVDPALDAESFDAAGFFRTGDLGTLDRDGYLRVTGRVKDIIVRKGEKISAREVEDLLAGHPAVAEVAVIPLADSRTGERACACVRLAQGSAAPSLAGLVDFLRARGLTAQKLPEQLEVVADFPRLPSGKIHKRLLREHFESRGA